MIRSLQQEEFITEEGKKIMRTKTEVWSRVMGYHRPVSSFNTGKKAEFYGRKNFKEEASFNSKFNNEYGDNR